MLELGSRCSKIEAMLSSKRGSDFLEKGFCVSEGRNRMELAGDGMLRLPLNSQGKGLLSVNSVSISPNGRWVASAASNHEIQLWDLQTGELAQTFGGHTDIVETVLFSADGKRIISGSWDRTIRVWDVKSGSQLQLMVGHASAVSAAALGSSDHLLASGSHDNSVMLWNWERGELISELGVHDSFVTAVTFNSKSSQLASGSRDQIIKLWDARNARFLTKLKYGPMTVEDLAYSPDGKILVSAAGDGVTGWNIRSGRQDFRIGLPGDLAKSVSFSPDGKQMRVIGKSKNFLFWEFSSLDQLDTSVSQFTSPQDWKHVHADFDGEQIYLVVHPMYATEIRPLIESYLEEPKWVYANSWINYELAMKADVLRSRVEAVLQNLRSLI